MMEENWAFIGYGEGIRQEEDWGVCDERPDLVGWGEG